MREGERPGWQNRTEAEIRTFYRSHKMTKIINVETQISTENTTILTTVYIHQGARKKTLIIPYNRFTQQRIFISKGFSLHVIYKGELYILPIKYRAIWISLEWKIVRHRVGVNQNKRGYLFGSFLHRIQKYLESNKRKCWIFFVSTEFVYSVLH